MTIAVAFWSALIVVLVIYGVATRRELETLWRKKKMHYSDPIREIMRRYEVGELTRDQFQSLLTEEMNRQRAQEKKQAS